LLDYLKVLGVSDNTIVIFSGDNGPEEAQPWRGTAGYFEGSYYPGHVPAAQVSNEIVHITDMFTTLLLWTGLEVPKDRVIDGVDQRAFFEGKQAASNRVGAHVAKILLEYQESLEREPLIPLGAPLDYVPKRTQP
jgi:arylsulfatase